MRKSHILPSSSSSWSPWSSFSSSSKRLPSAMNEFIGICLLSFVNVQIINSLSLLQPTASYLFASASPYQPVVSIAFGDNQTEVYHATPSINPLTSGWTPVINRSGANTQPNVNSVYTAINPSSSTIVSKVVPLVAPIANDQQNSASNITSQYLTSESITRSSFQKPQSTYMIHPAKYQQAFSNNSNRSNKTSKNLQKNFNRKSTNKGNKIINSEVMPIPMIKPHRHGATLGFNLPDQGLTLYLDINELATKPMAQNIGLKVVSHKDTIPENSDEEEDGANNNLNKSDKMIDLNHNLTASNSEKISQSRLNDNPATKSSTNSPKKISVKKSKFRYKMADNQTFKVITKQKKTNEYGNILSPIQVNNAKLSLVSHPKELGTNPFSTFNSKLKMANRSDVPPSASRIPNTYTTQTHIDHYEVDKSSLQQKEMTDGQEKEPIAVKKERDIVTFGHEEDEDEDEEGGETDTEGVTLRLDPNEEEDEEEENNSDLLVTTESPLETTTFMWPRKQKSASYVSQPDLSPGNDNTLEEEVRKQEAIDNELVQQMQALLEKSAKLIDLSASTCSIKNRLIRNPCASSSNSITSNTSTTIREIANQLEANLILNEIPSLFESELQDFMDFSSVSGYTIILPTNEAVRRLPPNLLSKWKQNVESFMVGAYLIEGKHSIESLWAQKSILTRNKMKLFISKPFNETYTINGQRVIYANQKSSNNGFVHVIDGLLWPSSDKDIINTLKSCGRFDGFVTLAEGTGFAEELRKNGPFTVFVPSNDALQKVPDSDLEIIRRNMTALKEFLMYHVAQGVFYSQDLYDGQYIPSILDGQYLQAGIRVDGCLRRLVEVNVSPLYRADIPASNGVIHVVDWILKPDDRDWCNAVILPRKR